MKITKGRNTFLSEPLSTPSQWGRPTFLFRSRQPNPAPTSLTGTNAGGRARPLSLDELSGVLGLLARGGFRRRPLRPWRRLPYAPRAREAQRECGDLSPLVAGTGASFAEMPRYLPGCLSRRPRRPFEQVCFP